MASDFWFKFYFKDWADDVKMLSLSSKGLLIELIIHLRKVNGEMPVDIGLIGRLSGGLTEEIKFALVEFRQNNIFDFIMKDGIEHIVSRKIIKELHKSIVNKENGKKGGNPNLVNSVNPKVNSSVKQKANRTSNSIFNSNSISNIDSNLKEVEPLIFPYTSNQFMDTWNVLIKEAKWKKKSPSALQASLKKLSEFTEEEAIQAMIDAISGGYQGVFPKKGVKVDSNNLEDYKQKLMNNIFNG